MAIHFFDSLSEAREFDRTDAEGLDLSTFRIVSRALGGVGSLKLRFRSRHHVDGDSGPDKVRPLPSGARRASNGRNIVYTGSKDGDGTNAVIYKQIDDGPREPLHLYTDFRCYYGSHYAQFRAMRSCSR
ncbi:hypothetical protein [Frigoriglobus tundricola]|uniref:Uncharacterized protein n=1 Tax=Frigoriglobus tundricola TaxID=2774151 RepID=A0A6M5Z7G0_9BACT|nr:hypothetical protein [Frigoriglobus tundricola]QJX01153.1 hypothetical protein FTUN_8792 [Frigoriglobus tundricola]